MAPLFRHRRSAVRQWHFPNFCGENSEPLGVVACPCIRSRKKSGERTGQTGQTGHDNDGWVLGTADDGHVKRRGTIVHRAHSSNLWINISRRHPVENYSRKCPLSYRRILSLFPPSRRFFLFSYPRLSRCSFSRTKISPLNARNPKAARCAWFFIGKRSSMDRIFPSQLPSAAATKAIESNCRRSDKTIWRIECYGRCL